MLKMKSIITALTLILVSLFGGVLIGQHTTDQQASDIGKLVEPFYGKYQSGIATKPQAHATLLAFNVNQDFDKAAAGRLLRLWTNDAANLTQGKELIGAVNPGMEKDPARLTVTFGFGNSFFEKIGVPSPIANSKIPDFAKIDKLQERWNGGDLVIQICGDDPLSVFNAVAMLKRDARPFAQVKWQQKGFLNSPGVNVGKTGRNLLGQLDGTANPDPTSKKFAKRVWREDGSTLMVVRRIELAIDAWDRLSTNRKGEVTGRKLVGGAPLSGGSEKSPVIKSKLPKNSHVELSFTDKNQGIYRRGYNYEDGHLNSGLIFISFQESIERFNRIQTKLAEVDALNTWTTPIGSALFYVPSGIKQGEWILGSLLK